MEYRIGFNEIIQAAKHLISGSHNPFIPGETYISPHGAVIDGNDISSIVQCALTGWFTEGKQAKEYKAQLRDYLDHQIRAVTLCNSGSSANLLAISAMTGKEFGERRLLPGDEVITTAVNFPTTVNAIVQNRAVPVMVDVDLCTYVPKVEAIEEAITEGKTKAIVLAHTLGNCFDSERIEDLCREYNIFMISDCCDALGSLYNGRHVETFGDMATHSYFPAHIITAGEGGAVMTDSPMIKKVVDSFASWGKDCFPAGTKVYSNGMVANIENVKVGDVVLSHTGNLRRVTELTGKMDTKFVYIKPRLMKGIVATDNHPFYVQTIFNGQKMKMFKKVGELKKGDYILEAMPKPVGSSPVEFTYSYETDINHDERVETLKIEPDLMRLIGYWLAEGNVATGFKDKYKKNKFYRVDFSFNLREEETIDDVCNLMYKYFGVVGQVRRARKDSYRASLSFKSRKGYEFFKQFFGRGAKNKHLPFNMMDWDLSLGLDQLIFGYWVGDGSSSKQGFSFGGISETLIYQLRRLLLRFGIVGSYWERLPKNHKQSIVNGKKINAKNILYSLNFYGKSAKRFGDLVGIKFDKNFKEEKVFLDSEYVYYPIEKLEKYEYTNPVRVYNLEVEIDHSYHANGIAVHNCWCVPGKDNTCGRRFEMCMGNLPLGYDHKYIFSRLGYNLKMTDLQAALLSSQIKKLPEFVEKRRENFMYLDNLMQEFDDWFWLPRASNNCEPSWFGYAITMKPYACSFSRKELIDYLEAHKVGTRQLFGGNLIRQPAYQDVEYVIHGNLNNSDIITEKSFWIGVWPGITFEMLDYVADVFRNFLKDKR